MQAVRRTFFCGIPWLLLAVIIGMPPGSFVFKSPTREYNSPSIALVGFGLSTKHDDLPWAIIRNERTHQEEIFEPGDTVFNSGKLLRVLRDGAEISVGPNATVIRLSLAGQDNLDISEELADIEGNDIFREQIDVENRPSLPNSQLSSTLAAAMVAQGTIASQGSFHSEIVGGEKRWGVRYDHIPPGSIFNTFGVQPGDFVYAINRREIFRESDIFALDNYILGDHQRAISLRVIRDGRPIVLRTLLTG